MNYFINSYMDLTIYDILNMIEESESVNEAITELFEEYDPNSALGWGDNFITLLNTL